MPRGMSCAKLLMGCGRSRVVDAIAGLIFLANSTMNEADHWARSS